MKVVIQAQDTGHRALMIDVLREKEKGSEL
jgi:hypothetical protein